MKKIPLFYEFINERGINMEFRGRQQIFSRTEATKFDRRLTIRPAVTDRCQRCGTIVGQEECLLPNGSYYCSACLRFGRITTEDLLVSENEEEKQPRNITFSWEGRLTAPQQDVSNQVMECVENQRHAMIWAVTGSGKTEMIFPIIKQVLEEGGRVAVCSPRIDVCRELHPRIKAVFPKEEVLLLYGDSEESYRYCSLTVCTTHQMMYFYQAFDLLIVDEIDAFPYEGDPQLHFAVKQAIKPRGNYIYLTATPPIKLLRELRETFTIVKLPIRFHQRPLIVPELLFYENWWTCYQNRWKLRKFLRYLRQLVKDNAVLVFCPSIEYMQKLYQRIKGFFPEDQTACVSSQDEERESKVEKMREQQYQILFTTTILERGVTFEKVSVIVMGANHPVYSKSALVQIAGRVDRKGAYNHGRVLFFFNQQTKDIRKACQEIKEMNQLAQRWRTNEL